MTAEVHIYNTTNSRLSWFEAMVCACSETRGALHATAFYNADSYEGSLERSSPGLGTLLVLFRGRTTPSDGPDEFARFVDRDRAPGGQHPPAHGRDDRLDHRRVRLQGATGASEPR